MNTGNQVVNSAEYGKIHDRVRAGILWFENELRYRDWFEKVVILAASCPVSTILETVCSDNEHENMSPHTLCLHGFLSPDCLNNFDQVTYNQMLREEWSNLAKKAKERADKYRDQNLE